MAQPRRWRIIDSPKREAAIFQLSLANSKWTVLTAKHSISALFLIPRLLLCRLLRYPRARMFCSCFTWKPLGYLRMIAAINPCKMSLKETWHLLLASTDLPLEVVESSFNRAAIWVLSLSWAGGIINVVLQKLRYFWLSSGQMRWLQANAHNEDEGDQ